MARAVALGVLIVRLTPRDQALQIGLDIAGDTRIGMLVDHNPGCRVRNIDNDEPGLQPALLDHLPDATGDIDELQPRLGVYFQSLHAFPPAIYQFDSELASRRNDHPWASAQLLWPCHDPYLMRRTPQNRQDLQLAGRPADIDGRTKYREEGPWR
jgi:hypothetical protein